VTNYKQPVSVLVVIYTSALDVLLLERADHPNYWQSVTGSCEVDESLRDTAIREIHEETALDANLHTLSDWQVQHTYEIYPHWRQRYAPGITRNTEHVFSLQLPHLMDIQLAPREHVRYKWLSWQDAAAKVFSPSNKTAILELPHRVRTPSDL
jgi:dATP pyrophosphohydrolase